MKLSSSYIPLRMRDRTTRNIMVSPMVPIEFTEISEDGDNRQNEFLWLAHGGLHRYNFSAPTWHVMLTLHKRSVPCRRKRAASTLWYAGPDRW
jgi:hypothetical protein